MNPITVKRINEFYECTQKYSLPVHIKVYTEHLKELANKYTISGDVYNITPEVEKNIYELIVKISNYKYMHPDLISLFSEAVVSFVDSQHADEKKFENLDKLFNKMEVSFNIEKHISKMTI